MLPRKWFLLFAFALLIVPFAPLSAQSQPTISIALPSFFRNVIDENIFNDFENANGVQVYINYVDPQGLDPAGGMDAYFDALATFAASADVLFVNLSESNPWATRAGYILDLTPLTSTDASLNPDDFAPSAWQSVQWDNGVWALPISLDANMMIYDPAVFDQARLAYPDGSWTIDDLSAAAKALAQYDAAGNITVPGLASFGNTALLFRSLYGQDFFDASGNPRFADPALEDIMTKWQDLVDGGYVGNTFTSGGSNQVPMRIMGSFGLGFGGPDNNQPAPAAVALPGGKVGLTLSALAVSSGTQQPELAYALAKYLTSNPALAKSPLGGFPARQSLRQGQFVSSNAPDNGGAGGGIRILSPGSSPQAQAALTQLLPDALTLSEQRYAVYVDSALRTMSGGGVDAHTALQQAEAQATADLQTAADRGTTASVIVATPVPPVVLQPGEIALNFGLQSNIQPIPNLDRWQQLAQDFAAADSEVGVVNLDTSPRQADQFTANDDCFYLTSNAVPNLGEATLLNLDPYMDTDPNFDPNDVVNGVMAQLQKDNHTWAYPLILQAQTLSYNVPIFQQAGVPLPDSGWTIDQFVDALHTLKDYLDKTPFVPHDLNGESLLLLIAAYGGLPVDYRTSPPTRNFTDPATVAAIQQVLDLAKNGYIDYQPLITGKVAFRIVANRGGQPDAITSDSLGGFRNVRGAPGAMVNDTHLAAYPTGVYTSASYTVGAGYISATAQNPDACYHWLSYVGQHVDVFGSMPARLSQINDPAMQTTLGDNASFYAAYAQTLQNSATIFFPVAGRNSTASDFMLHYWLFHAFDNYVQHDADLNAELADAQTYATAFQQCVAALPPGDTTSSGPDLSTGVRDCATSIDPGLVDLFPGG